MVPGLLPQGVSCEGLIGVGGGTVLLGHEDNLQKGCTRAESSPWPSSQCFEDHVAFPPWGQGSDAELSWSRIVGERKRAETSESRGVFLDYLPLPTCPLSVGLAKVSFK